MKKIFLILIALFISGCNKVDDSKSITSSESEDAHPCPSLFVYYYDSVNGVIVEYEGQKMFHTDLSYGFYETNSNYCVNENFVYNGFYSIDWAFENSWIRKIVDDTGYSQIIENYDDIPIGTNCIAYFAIDYGWECQEYYPQYPRPGVLSYIEFAKLGY